MFQLSSNRNDRKTAIYVRISTGMQKTDRQVTELLEYANSVGIRVNEEDIFVDIISGFKDGEIRPKYSDLKRRIEDGEYQQILFSEFSRLDRKPSNLLKSIEYYQNRGVFLYFRNLGLRHENMLKHLMRCGNCGSKFSVSGGLLQRKYRCYGTASRKYEKERICDKGVELLMRKFDGMVLHLCIRKFADYDAEKSTAATIEYLNREIEDKTRIISEYKEQLKEETERFSSYVRRVLKTAATDDEVQEWTRNERADYEQKTAEIKKAMARVSRKLAPMKSRLFSLQRMQSHVNILAKQEEILADKNIVSEYVNEFIRAIVTYRIAKIWTLVVIQFVDGSEFWGLGKNARYKVSEMRNYHDQDRDTEYYTWVIDNSAHLLTVDKDTGIISVKPGFDGFISGEYSFAEFDQMVREKGCYGYYSEYQFE